MEDLKLTVNEDFAKKLHRQKERVELDQCKYCKAFREGLKIRTKLPGQVIIDSSLVPGRNTSIEIDHRKPNR